MKKKIIALSLSLLVCFIVFNNVYASDLTLLNVSHDPTRELYKEFNLAFIKYWKQNHDDTVKINQSHDGSGKQARAVIDGLEADVVTLALAYDIDQLATKAKLIPDNWQSLLPSNSTPYTSTIVFLVRKGNPKKIKDWNDIIQSGVGVVTPNPKTSGGARWNYIAAWGYALKNNGNDENAAKEFLTKLYQNTTVLDTGARGSTTSFAERGLGDVLITWENDANIVLKQFGNDNFEIITPSYSILAEPPVAVVTKNTEKHGTTGVATEYLNYLYSKEGQEIIAKNFYRPIDKEIAAKYSKQFPTIELGTISQFGGWTEVQNKHFADNGIFDQIYRQ